MTNECKKYYIGIDVSKAVLDIYILPLKLAFQVKNDGRGIEEFLQRLLDFSSATIVMEATGGYEKAVFCALAKTKHSVAVVNPRRMRDFAKAVGRLAKTDRIDAQVIALFAEKVQPRVNVRASEEQQTLSETQARRRQIIDMMNQEKNRLDKANPELKKSIKRILETLEKELEKINELLKSIIARDDSYTRKNELLKSIKGIGGVVAAGVMADLPELGKITGKQITALVGLAPYNRDSGMLRGKRTIWGGRGSVRALLYMATLTAIKHNGQIKIFYQRLCQAGKQKKVALTACMHKLLVIMNAVIKHNEPWREMAVLKT